MGTVFGQREIDRTVARVDGFWQEQARHMISSVCGRAAGWIETDIKDVRIAKNWPLHGSISFTRESDNRRFRAYLNGRKWLVRETR